MRNCVSFKDQSRYLSRFEWVNSSEDKCRTGNACAICLLLWSCNIFQVDVSHIMWVIHWIEFIEACKMINHVWMYREKKSKCTWTNSIWNYSHEFSDKFMVFAYRTRISSVQHGMALVGVFFSSLHNSEYVITWNDFLGSIIIATARLKCAAYGAAYGFKHWAERTAKAAV